MDKIIYLDNAATTKVSKPALDAMLPFLSERYGNPSSIYSVGRDAKKAIEGARTTVSNLIGALSEEIFFTGSGTESNNWAIKSASEMLSDKGRHIITSAIEHPAVLETLAYLETKGYEVSYLGVDKYGQISIDELKNTIREDTIIISIMTANNEIGTILPVSEIGKLAREKGILFHTDAVQAVGSIAIDVAEMNVDLLTFSGHKLGAAKGVGVLYIKKELKLPPFIHGGGQENGKRSGTENVAGIAGLAAALEYRTSKLPLEGLAKKRDRLIKQLLNIPKSSLTGDPKNRLPGIASFVFEAIEGESMLLLLDHFGICGSSGSACSSGSLDPSHVLLAIGLPHEIAHGSLRLSLSEETTDEEIDFVIEKLTEIVAKLRAMSPVWNEPSNIAP